MDRVHHLVPPLNEFTCFAFGESAAACTIPPLLGRRLMQWDSGEVRRPLDSALPVATESFLHEVEDAAAFAGGEV